MLDHKEMHQIAAVSLLNQRPLLLLDPHRHMTAWLRKALGVLNELPQGVREFQARDVIAEGELETCSRSGIAILLTQVEDLQFHPLPLQWSALLCKERPTSWHVHFRLIMSNASSKPMLPAHQLKNTLIVDCTLTTEALQQQVHF